MKENEEEEEKELQYDTNEFSKDAKDFQDKEDLNAEDIQPVDIDTDDDSRKLDWIRNLCKRSPPT